jgi:hypothetical protein
LADFRFHGFVVALFAVEIAVCAFQPEISLFVVIENPYTPTVRVMTLLAVCSEGGFMLVILFVTGIAFAFSVLESRRDMTFLAGGQCMHAE